MRLTLLLLLVLITKEVVGLRFALRGPQTLRHQNVVSPRARSVRTGAATLRADLDGWRVVSTLSVVSTIGVWGERTRFGAALSSPLLTMALSMFLCNVGLLPRESPIYTLVIKYLVPLSIPLLLLDANLKRCISTTGNLLKAFLLGSVGTVVGTLVAYALVPMRNTVGGAKIAAALCARHIGGAVNFVAVADILKISPELVAASMAADNVVVALYFAFLFLISVPERNDEDEAAIPVGVEQQTTSLPPSQTTPEQCPIPFFRNSASSPSGEAMTPAAIPSAPVVPAVAVQRQQPRSSDGFGLLRLMAALSVGLVLCTLSQALAAQLGGTSPLLLVSLLAVIVATLFPASMGRVSKAGGVLGVVCMQFFFAVTGGMGHIGTVMRYGPSVFWHTSIQIAVHFLFTTVVGKWLGISFRELIVASNANVGGPTTAAAMATSKRWKALVLPALLTGIFGYAIATVVGVAVVRVLK